MCASISSFSLKALLGTLFTWGVTALGALVVIVPLQRFGLEQKKVDQTSSNASTRSFNCDTLVSQVLDAMLGFAAGVMIAASFWSLLAPGSYPMEIVR